MFRRVLLPAQRANRIAPLILAAGAFVSAQLPQFRAFAADPAPTPPPSMTVRSTQPTDTLQLTDLQSAFENIAGKVAPSVVAISASVTAIESEDAVHSDQLNTEHLTTMLERVTRTVGTGFVFDSDGYILTNEHVIGESQQLWITTDDRKVYPAIVVGSDPRSDLAVLKVPANHLQAIHWAKPDSVKRGEWTIAMGNPYGLAETGEMAMSVGVVSALDRSLQKLSNKEDRNYSNLIQTTAEINPGNSGGPLFDLNGDVIGINSAVILPQKETSGIGFAFPVTQHLLDEVNQLKQGREITYAYLGVTVSTPTASMRKVAGVKLDSGVCVDLVDAKSPASSAIQVDDIILSINGQSVNDSDAFVNLVGTEPADQSAKISLMRAGKPIDVTVKLGNRHITGVAITKDTQRIRWRGLLLGPIPANWDGAKSKKIDGGLMVLGVADDSPLARKVSTGTIITSVAGKPVRAVQDLQTILNDTPAPECSIQFSDAPTPQVASLSQN
jgi:serine protease Do